MAQRGLLVGVTMNRLPADPERAAYNGRELLYTEESMGRWLIGRGHATVALPFVPAHRDHSACARAQAAHLDALVIHGGADVAPPSYGEQPLRPEWAGDAPRDRYEIACIRACMSRGVPILGVCRGHQILNVACGGTLYQDIAEQVGPEIAHRDAERYHRLDHPVCLEPGSILHGLYGVQHGRVNSVHHQAIKACAPDLEPCAWAPDGVIEGVWHTDPDVWALGVQWHPEFQEPEQRQLLGAHALLEALIEAAYARKVVA